MVIKNIIKIYLLGVRSIEIMEDDIISATNIKTNFNLFDLTSEDNDDTTNLQDFIETDYYDKVLFNRFKDISKIYFIINIF